MRKWVEEGDAPEIVADTVVKAAAARPNLRYSAGRQSGRVRALRRFLPERMVDGALRKFNSFPA